MKLALAVPLPGTVTQRKPFSIALAPAGSMIQSFVPFVKAPFTTKLGVCVLFPVLTGCWALARPRRARLASVLVRISAYFCGLLGE